MGLLAFCAGCSRRPPNILVILVDTLRADRLGAYDGRAGLTPFIDSLAARAFVFRQAYAQAPWTNPSVASLFTSRYQSQHGIVSFASVLGEQELTLAEVLHERGYATAGFNANYLLPRKTGFAQGFDEYRTLPAGAAAHEPNGVAKARAARVNSEGLSWLDKRAHPEQPFFLYLHYMEPHNPYEPETAYLDRVLAGRPRPDRAVVNTRMNMPNVGVFSDDMVQAVRDFYDAEVMSFDAQLRELFAGLAARGLLDRTVVALVADHGEEFREHGLMGHGQTLFDEVIHVPLLLLVPGHTHRTDVGALVSVVDLGPTLLDFAGIAAPPTFEGHSLRPLMGLPANRAWGLAGCSAPQATPPTLIFSELIKDDLDRLAVHERAVRGADDKLIAGVHGEQEFYDLRTDPGETNPAGLGEAQRSALDRQLSSFRARVAHGAPAATRPLDDQTRERMRALGYGDK